MDPSPNCKKWPCVRSEEDPVYTPTLGTVLVHAHPCTDRMSAIVTRNIGVAARQWANRVSVRTVVIPGSHQEPLKEAAKRIGYWGEEQDIDSRWEPDQGPMFTPRAFEHGLRSI